MKQEPVFRKKLMLVSTLTILFLIFLLSTPVLLVMLIFPTYIVTILTLLPFLMLILNIILFFKSPSLMDSALKDQYGSINWIALEEFKESYPMSGRLIQKVCKKYKINHPKMAIVDDKEILAFTYGNFRCNARIVVSAGLLNLLTDEELAAVYAHELGHIVTYDFVVMTFAQTLTICLSTLASAMKGANSGSNRLVLIAIAVLSLIFSYIGFIASLYLSRIREFSADNFAAKNISDPSALSRALVKMVYKSASLKRINALTQSARALNIFDLSAKKSISAKKGQETQNIMQSLFYPSSRWKELKSTHPFPMSRINALSDYSKQKAVNFEVNISEIISNLEETEITSDDVNSESEHLTNSKPQNESRSIKILMRRNRVLLALGSLMFFGGSIFFLFIINNSTQDKIISIISGLLGITCLVAFINSIYQEPGYIFLTNAGIKIQYPSFFGKEVKKLFFKWSDIEKIGVGDSDVKFIGFNFSDSYTGEMPNFTLDQVFFDYDFFLPDNFDNHKPEELCYKLQKWKNFYS